MKKVLWLVLALALVTSLGTAAAQEAQTPTQLCEAAGTPPDPASRTFEQPDNVLEPGVDYRAILCTDVGAIYIDLFETLTPVTVNSFVFLAQQGFYNNTTFHRVIQDFMAQGGDPTGTGAGGPGYQFEDEPVGFLTFDVPGWLAMANAGAGTNGSQFFITTVPTPHLDYQHTIFGEVLEGADTVSAIKLRDPATATDPGTTLKTVLIISDPATVQSTHEDAATATQEEVTAAFNGMAETITSDVSELLTQETITQTTADLVAAAPEAEREAYGDFLERNNHEYRISNTVTNVACDMESIVFGYLRYTLDSFATPQDAAAALADEYMAQFPLQAGFTATQASENLPYPLFTSTETLCDREMIRAMTFMQRGHFIATAEMTFPADNENVAFLDRVLSVFVMQRVFEPILAEVLRPEIR